MSDHPPSAADREEPDVPVRSGRIGFGTLSILVIFFGIISAMCLGAILIVVAIAFR